MNGHQKQKEQSVRMIEEALFKLMEEKNYTQITVSEVAKRADISRRTFYRFYKERDEVLRCYLGKLCQEYQRTTLVLAYYEIPQIAREYFACYSAGGFGALLEQWIREGMTESPKEYAEKVSKGLLQFIQPSL